MFRCFLLNICFGCFRNTHFQHLIEIFKCSLKHADSYLLIANITFVIVKSEFCKKDLIAVGFKKQFNYYKKTSIYIS